MDDTSFLTKDEIQLVAKRLGRLARHKRGTNARLNLAIFRLSCCCGLRCIEIAGLKIDDLTLDGPRPAIRIRPEITKGKNGKRVGRSVPLWWDSGTRDDLAMILEWRKTLPGEEFLVSLRPNHAGKPLTKDSIASRWGSAIKVLGEGRRRQLSIHKGRHSFISHALNAGRSLVEVQRAAGHRSIASTGVYLHYLEREHVGDVFGE